MTRRWLTLSALCAGLALAAPSAAAANGIGGIIADVSPGSHVHHAAMARAAALDYEGGPVLHSNRTHLIFWQPSNSGLSFEPGYEALMERFLGQVAADSHRPTNVYGLSGQYTDSAGPAAYASSYGGALLDTDPLPVNGCLEPPTSGPGWLTCLIDEQLQQELEHIVAAAHLPRDSNDIYFLVLPNGFGSCTDATSQSCALGGDRTGYCGYHSQTGGNLLYAVIPYNAVRGHCQSDNPRPNGNAADPAISTLSHEHNEVVTDPETYSSWIDGNGQENGDLCITNFGPKLGGRGSSAWNEVVGGGHYYLQEEWSNEDASCQPRDESDPVSFSAPGRVLTGRALRLSARAGDPDGAIIGYAWSFGDGAGSHRRITSHAFARPGTYRITLRVSDRAANWAWSTRTIRVLPAAARERHRRRRRLATRR